MTNEEKEIIVAALKEYKDSIRQQQLNIIKSQAITCKVTQFDLNIMKNLEKRNIKVYKLLNKLEGNIDE